jgi:Phage tail assembly chaperone proteins, E, or 41 or 14
VMAPLTHTLNHPILFEKKNPETGEIDAEELKPAGFLVTLRRPKAQDLKAFDRHGEAEIAAIIDMIARCSNLSGIEADNLDGEDFGALGNLLAVRSPGGLTTGSSA